MKILIAVKLKLIEQPASVRNVWKNKGDIPGFPCDKRQKTNIHLVTIYQKKSNLEILKDLIVKPVSK